jgi:predicted dehydrogenase
VYSWWNLAPHDLSILLYIMDGQLPEVVSADGKAFIQAGVEDVVFANLKWNEGPLANVHVSWLDPHKMRKVTIVGSKKMAIFDDMSLDAPVTVFDKGFDAIPKHGENMHFDLTPSRAGYALRHGGIQIPSINRVEPLNAELTDFVNSILMEKSPFACNKQACDVVKLLEDGQNALKR